MSSDYREGSIRYQDETGLWHVAEPNSPMFSTVSLIATEYWCTQTGTWKPIFDNATDTETGEV